MQRDSFCRFFPPRRFNRIFNIFRHPRRRNMPLKDSALFLPILAVILLLGISPAQAQTVLPGTISSHTTLGAGVYLIQGDVDVQPGVTLTIEAGAFLKVQRRFAIRVSGSLIASGTLADPVVFTDYRDDTAGGDTNGDGSASPPAPGWWAGIIIESGGTASLDHADIRYGGYAGHRNLWVDGGGDLTLTNSVIQFSQANGVEIRDSAGTHTLTGNQIDNNGGVGIALINADGMIEVSGNAFADNGTGIDVYGTALATQNTQITGNTISGGARGIRLSVPDASPAISGNTIGGNSLAPLAVAGGNIDETTSWDADETYFVENDINVLAGGGLTLPAGAVVKVQNRDAIRVSGSLIASGTLADPVVFTDYRDDTAGGDTNGDGSASPPAPGWWAGIIIESGGTASLDHADIRYGGYAGHRNLWVDGGGDLTLTNSVIQFSQANGVEIRDSAGTHTLTGNQIDNNGGVGIALINADGMIEISDNVLEQNAANGVKIEESSPTVLDNEITDNSVAGILVTGAAATPDLFGNLIANNGIGVDATSDANPLIGGSLANGNDILGNTDFGVRNQSAGITIDARYNWWGAENGPQHPSLNPDGSGNAVSDRVDFEPWLGASALQPEPNIAVTPPSLDFATLPLEEPSAAQSVVVENRGTAPLDIAQLALAGDHPGDFEIVSDAVSNSTIDPLESATVDVRFVATDAGIRSALLQMPSNDPEMPTAEIALAGEGVLAVDVLLEAAAAVVRTGTSAMFAVRVTGQQSVPQGGEVEVVADTGESCLDSDGVTDTGSTVLFECSITFPNAGPRQLTASYSGSTTHIDGQSAAVGIDVMAFADLSVTLDVMVTPAFPPTPDTNPPVQQVDYTVELRNAGPDDAPNSLFLLVMEPSEQTFDWTCQDVGAANCSMPAGSGDISWILDIPAGAGLDLSITAPISEPPPVVLRMLADISADSQAPHHVFDPVASDNTIEEITPVDLLFRDSLEE